MGTRRQEWRAWPKRRTVEVHRDLDRLTYVLECGHGIKMTCRKAGWPQGITAVKDACPPRFACGHCHYGSPRGASAPDTGRCEFFDRWRARRQRRGVEAVMSETSADTPIIIIDTVTAIRKRPGMYVGDLGATGVHHMLYWAFDDILSNARARRGQLLKVVLNADGSCKLCDDGPVFDTADLRDRTVEERLEVLLSEMPIGGERGVPPPSQIRSYLPVLRALSVQMEVHARVRGVVYRCMYERGVRLGSWETVDDMPESTYTQMRVVFRPDPEVFSATEFDPARVRARLQEMAATCSDLVTDLGVEATFGRVEYEQIRMPDGMADMATVLMEDAGETLRVPKAPFRFQVTEGDMAFDVAVQWHHGKEMGDGETSFSWANTVATRSGSHVLGVREAVKAVGLDDVPYLACVSVFVPQPRFVTPTKTELRSPEIRVLLRDHVTVALRRLSERDDFAMSLEGMRETRARWAREDAEEAAWRKKDR